MLAPLGTAWHNVKWATGEKEGIPPRNQQHAGAARRFRHHSVDRTAATVKHDAGVTLLQAQNLGGMVRFIPSQLPGGSSPFGRREEKAGHV
ncbi:hypothetical protein M5E88_13485 [Akkermansia muciniphila]|nr:hypothetical protein M5E88_13485 [Akkermansia muciniphila]